MSYIVSFVVAVLALAIPVRAGVILVPFEFSTSSEPFTQHFATVNIPAHNPATGNLVGLRIDAVEIEHKGVLKIENLAPAGGFASMSTQAAVTLRSPAGNTLVAHGPLGLTARPVRLAANDGVLDFDGASGRTIPFRIDVDVPAPFSTTDPAVLAEFVGVGTVALTVERSGAQNYQLNTGKGVHQHSHFVGLRVRGTKLVSLD